MSTTAPLREAIAEALPDRPFRIDLWDGTSLPPTNGGGPTFTVRSERALAHALRAPGQLGDRAGVRRAARSRSTTSTRSLDLLDTWKPPPLDLRTKATLAAAAVRATGPTLPPKPPAAELRPIGSPALRASATSARFATTTTSATSSSRSSSTRR